MTRPPVTGDAMEHCESGAVFSVVGVREVGKGAAGKGLGKPRLSIVMICVIGPTHGWRDKPTRLGDMHHIGGTWESLEDHYVLLTA